MLPSIFGENLFDEFFTDPFAAVNASVNNALYGKHARREMKTDVRETDNGYEVDVDLPGFKKENVNVDLSNGYLTIAASKGLDKNQQDDNGRYIRRERYAGSMSRSFYVGDVRPQDVSAKFEDGILRLTMPKAGQQRLPENNRICIE